MAIAAAAAYKGDLSTGMMWMRQPGTYQQFLDSTPYEERSWSVPGKIIVMVLFSSMGFFGSSCSAAITKQFGALTMSITSTARKAMTLFLSFFLFNNVCTLEHIAGVVIFITALTTKSMRRRNNSSSNGISRKKKRNQDRQRVRNSDFHLRNNDTIELGRITPTDSQVQMFHDDNLTVTDTSTAGLPQRRYNRSNTNDSMENVLNDHTAAPMSGRNIVHIV